MVQSSDSGGSDSEANLGPKVKVKPPGYPGSKSGK